MASPFQRYQGGIEASTTNLVPAYGQMAQQTAGAMANFGQSLAEGIKQYNENSAKNDILTSEAEQLSQQILQFKNMFGDSPEHKPFADSLQPYIEQLAKVPSMSLTQKMGAVTGVKAAFGNIGQQLQVFEMMRGERMKRDINNARMGVREFDEQTVPTAIIPSGKMPYFYNKSYAENEAELVRLTNEAKAKGANVDLPTVLSNWRNGLKANAMSRTDIPPQVKEALTKQISSAEGLVDNVQTSEDGVTDYAKEAEMYERTTSSVKDQLAPKKTQAPAKQDTAAGQSKEEKDLIQKREAISTAIETLNKRLYKNKNVSKEDIEKFNKDKASYESEKKSIEAKIAALQQAPETEKSISQEEYMQLLEKEYGGGAGANTRAQLDGWTSNTVHNQRGRRWTKKSVDSNVSRTLDYWSGKLKEVEGRKPTAPDQQVEVLTDAEFNDKVEQLYGQGNSRYTGVAELERQGWERSKDANGNQIWVNRNPIDKPVASALEALKGELGKLPMPQRTAQKSVDPKVAEAESVKRRAKDELVKIDALIKQADKAISEEKDIPMGWMDKASYAIESGLLDSINQKGFQEMARMYISQGRVKEITPDVARMILNELNSDSMGGIAALGAIITPDPSAFGLGLIDSTRQLSREEKRNLEGAFTDWRSQDRIKRIEKSGDAEFLKQELVKRKQLLQSQLATGRSAPKPADVAKVQQAKVAQEKKPEQEYALTNQNALSLGTTTMQIATSIDNKRKDMMGFFQKKYGYIPASFEESFKAIYPEASFKTMETPYGAFMYDGKEWKQIQIQQPKVMTNKEIGEEKAVTFGTPKGDGTMDFQELVPKSGIYVRGIYAGTPTEANKFRTEMLETANARVAVNRLIEINDMVGESMPWNAKLWGEAKALLPQIKAGLRTDIIGVGTVSNYEQQLIEEVVADPTKFWSLESSDRAKLAEIMRRVNNRLTDRPAMFGLEVRTAGQTNAEIERNLRLGRAGKSKLELDFENRGGSKGVKLNWKLSNQIPDALKD